MTAILACHDIVVMIATKRNTPHISVKLRLVIYINVNIRAGIVFWFYSKGLFTRESDFALG
jgi:hypothetical protein